MKRRTLLAALPLTALVTLTACGPSVTGEDKETTKKAEEVSARFGNNPTTFDLLVDFRCPHCKDLHESLRKRLRDGINDNEFSLRVFARPMLDLAEGRKGHTKFSTLTASAFYDLYESDQKLAWTWMEKAMNLQPDNPAIAEPDAEEIAEALKQINAPESVITKVTKPRINPAVEKVEEYISDRWGDQGTPVLIHNDKILNENIDSIDKDALVEAIDKVVKKS